MYRFFTTCLRRRLVMILGLVYLLTGCTLVDAPAPQLATAEAVQPSEHKLAWEGLIIQVPAQATFKPFPSVAAPATNGLPVIAAGAITYSSQAATTDGAQWYGPSLMLFRFAGSAEEWIDLERQASQPQAVGSPPRRVIEESIQPRTIAGKPGLAYQFAASSTTEPTMEQYAVKLADEQLLVIVTQDTRNPTYQSVIDTLQPQP